MTPPADAWVAEDPIPCPICGRESCEDHLSTPSTKPATGLRFATAHEAMKTAAPIEIIQGIASSDRVTTLVSESGTGKTFVLLDQAAAVSDGLKWHGRVTRQGSVAIVSFEGDAIGLRLRALHQIGGHKLEHVHLVRAHDPLSPRVTRDGEERSIGERDVLEAVEALTETLKTSGRPPISLLIVDTVRASLSGNEDNSEHAAAYLRAVRRIMTHLPGAAAILAHHAGWQDGENQRKRERGTSAWRGNVDITLYLEAGAYDPKRGEAELTLSTLKVRDGERPAPLHLVRRRVYLNERDQYGEPITSCVIEADGRSRDDREAAHAASVEASLRETDVAVLRAMRDYPAATSAKRLRPYIGKGADQVSESVARILRAKLALEGKRGQPYVITEAGIASLNGGQTR